MATYTLSLLSLLPLHVITVGESEEEEEKGRERERESECVSASFFACASYTFKDVKYWISTCLTGGILASSIKNFVAYGIPVRRIYLSEGSLPGRLYVHTRPYTLLPLELIAIVHGFWPAAKFSLVPTRPAEDRSAEESKSSYRLILTVWQGCSVGRGRAGVLERIIYRSRRQKLSLSLPQEIGES